MGGSGKGINPIGGGHGSLEEQGAGDIVGGTKHVLGFAILLRGIGTRHAERNTFSKKESTRRRVVKLTAVVTLYRFDGAAELSVYMSEKNWK